MQQEAATSGLSSESKNIMTQVREQKPQKIRMNIIVTDGNHMKTSSVEEHESVFFF